MKILALESSTASASVAVCIDGQVVAFEQSMSPRTHSEFLNPAVDACLKKSRMSLKDFDLFAAGRGPGSFTGLRVAGNIAKTFAMAFQKPMVAVDSLRLMFEQTRLQKFTSMPCLCVINAHKNLLYTGLYRVLNRDTNQDTETLQEPAALNLNQINDLVKSFPQFVCVGDGWTAYESVFSEDFKRRALRDPSLSDYPLASTLGILSEHLGKSNQTIDWKSFQPLYIRASEAEENQRVKTL